MRKEYTLKNATFLSFLNKSLKKYLKESIIHDSSILTPQQKARPHPWARPFMSLVGNAIAPYVVVTILTIILPL